MGIGMKILFVLAGLCGVAVLVLLLSSSLLKPEPFGPAIAPDPVAHRDPIVQIYGADVWGVRGRFAIHTWVATKGLDEPSYTIYQVIGWQLRRKGTAVSVESSIQPNRPWFRSPPILLYEQRGSGVEHLVEAIAEAAETYPFAREYVMWPGPNSNSFTQWIISRVPGLNVELPAKAIGKNWMADYLATASTAELASLSPVETIADL